MEHWLDAHDLLAEIARRLAKHRDDQRKDPLNHGYVGDMERLYKDLIGIESYLKP